MAADRLGFWERSTSDIPRPTPEAHQAMVMALSDRRCLATPNLEADQQNHRAVPCR